MVWTCSHHIQFYICNIYLENNWFIPLAIHVCFLPHIFFSLIMREIGQFLSGWRQRPLIIITCVQQSDFTLLYFSNQSSNLSVIFGKMRNTFFFQPLNSEVVFVFVTKICFLYAEKCWILISYPDCQLFSFYWGTESIHIVRY